MKENVIVDKSFQFAVKIVKLSQYLVNEKKEYVISKQVLKSGTSIGANIEEAEGGFSKKDFIAKMNFIVPERLKIIIPHILIFMEFLLIPDICHGFPKL